MKRFVVALLALSLLSASGVLGQSTAAQSGNSPLEKLADDFWNWRARFAPFTSDDVNRVERPGGVRDWSAAAIAKRRADLTGFACAALLLLVARRPQFIFYQLAARWEIRA